ncbi:MAG: hypothetical protein P1U65_03500 [Minwuia sp.]|nr:hypothetical protein [Minwuia sp.]
MLSAATVETFHRDGAILLPGVISADWVARVRAAIDKDIAEPGPFCHGYTLENGRRFHGNMRIWESDPTFHDYCHNSPLPALAAELMGADRITLF